MNNLPPQAYTRDVLVKAIEWLSTQPQAVRERASSADLIVNFYLQAKRKLAAQMEAPVSGETFKNDLKHLVEDLKQFEEPVAPPQVPASQVVSIHAPAHGHLSQPAQTYYQQPVAQHHYVPPSQVVPPPPVHPQPQPAPQPQMHVHPPPPVHAAPAAVTWTVDPRSLSAARELQQRFNLSNETEALRFLVTLGIERAKQML